MKCVQIEAKHIRTNEKPEASIARSAHKKTKKKNNATRNQHQLLR
jgi:hypothetical protein